MDLIRLADPLTMKFSSRAVLFAGVRMALLTAPRRAGYRRSYRISQYGLSLCSVATEVDASRNGSVWSSHSQLRLRPDYNGWRARWSATEQPIRPGNFAMQSQWKQQAPRIRLQDLCARLEVPYRDARYFCEKSWLPEGVERDPGRGNHRQLTPAQAMWLGIVLKLKGSGVKPDKAAKIMTFAARIREFTRNSGWDWRFSPFDGKFETEHQWYIDVGDMKYVRIVTDACPSKQGLDATPWVDMDSRELAKNAKPIVQVRVDISALARLLQALSP